MYKEQATALPAVASSSIEPHRSHDTVLFFSPVKRKSSIISSFAWFMKKKSSFAARKQTFFYLWCYMIMTWKDTLSKKILNSSSFLSGHVVFSLFIYDNHYFFFVKRTHSETWDVYIYFRRFVDKRYFMCNIIFLFVDKTKWQWERDECTTWDWMYQLKKKTSLRLALIGCYFGLKI